MAAKTVFALAHRHGDILREGWKNILDCMLQLYRAKMLPDILISVEDFIDPSGRISLIKEEKVMTRWVERVMLYATHNPFHWNKICLNLARWRLKIPHDFVFDPFVSMV
jgi:hypothetical protein